NNKVANLLQKVVPSKVVVDKDGDMLMLVFDEALGVGDGYISACIDICYLSNPECYGSLLTLDELKEFDMLSDDYEINWHLRSVINPTSKDLRSGETLLKSAEEALLMEKIGLEQQRLGVDEMYWVGNKRYEEQEEQEEEEDEDDKEVEEGKHGDANVREPEEDSSISIAAMDGLNCFKTSRMILVELARTERQEAIGATRERQKEARHINRLLTQLGNLSNILAEVSQTGKK
nr:kinesin-like protein KIN-12B [Tanacetum cinerariifolium]